LIVVLFTKLEESYTHHCSWYVCPIVNPAMDTCALEMNSNAEPTRVWYAGVRFVNGGAPELTFPPRKALSEIEKFPIVNVPEPKKGTMNPVNVTPFTVVVLPLKLSAKTPVPLRLTSVLPEISTGVFQVIGAASVARGNVSRR